MLVLEKWYFCHKLFLAFSSWIFKKCSIPSHKFLLKLSFELLISEYKNWLCQLYRKGFFKRNKNLGIMNIKSRLKVFVEHCAGWKISTIVIPVLQLVLCKGQSLKIGDKSQFFFIPLQNKSPLRLCQFQYAEYRY